MSVLKTPAAALSAEEIAAMQVISRAALHLAPARDATRVSTATRLTCVLGPPVGTGGAPTTLRVHTVLRQRILSETQPPARCLRPLLSPALLYLIPTV